MTKEFFGKQMDRLRNVYSPASVSNERIEIMWTIFKGTNGEAFEAGLNFLIGEFTTQALPSVSKMQEAVARFRPQQSSSNAAPSKHYANCAFCHRLGIVTAKTRVAPHYEVLFRCSCGAGEAFKARAETWDFKRHMDAYALLEPPVADAVEGACDAERAADYARSIKHMLRRFKLPALPYDPSERISG